MSELLDSNSYNDGMPCTHSSTRPSIHLTASLAEHYCCLAVVCSRRWQSNKQHRSWIGGYSCCCTMYLLYAKMTSTSIISARVWLPKRVRVNTYSSSTEVYMIKPKHKLTLNDSPQTHGTRQTRKLRRQHTWGSPS